MKKLITWKAKENRKPLLIMVTRQTEKAIRFSTKNTLTKTGWKIFLSMQSVIYKHSYSVFFLHLTVTLPAPPYVHVNNVKDHCPLVISSTSSGCSISIPATLYVNSFPTASVNVMISPSCKLESFC